MEGERAGQGPWHCTTGLGRTWREQRNQRRMFQRIRPRRPSCCPLATSCFPRARCRSTRVEPSPQRQSVLSTELTLFALPAACPDNVSSSRSPQRLGTALLWKGLFRPDRSQSATCSSLADSASSTQVSLPGREGSGVRTKKGPWAHGLTRTSAILEYAAAKRLYIIPPMRRKCLPLGPSSRVPALITQSSPCLGLTSCAGSAPGRLCTSSTRCTISALPWQKIEIKGHRDEAGRGMEGTQCALCMLGNSHRTERSGGGCRDALARR